MILVKDMHGKNHWAYADKTIVPWTRVYPSPELIQFWSETRWAKPKKQEPMADGQG